MRNARYGLIKNAEREAKALLKNHRFLIQNSGSWTGAANWKDVRSIIKRAALPLIMKQIRIEDQKTKKAWEPIIRKDLGRVRLVKDGGRSVIPW